MKNNIKKSALKSVKKHKTNSTKNIQFLADWGYSVVENYENIPDYISQDEIDETDMSYSLWKNIRNK